jgi:hypothetical protein
MKIVAAFVASVQSNTEPLLAAVNLVLLHLALLHLALLQFAPCRRHRHRHHRFFFLGPPQPPLFALPFDSSWQHQFVHKAPTSTSSLHEHIFLKDSFPFQ